MKIRWANARGGSNPPARTKPSMHFVGPVRAAPAQATSDIQIATARMAQPTGPNIAIALSSQPHNPDVDQLWLVAADGKATQVLNEVFYPAFNAGF